jgi:hypothetical protein
MKPKKGLAILMGMPHDGDDEESPESGEGPSDDDKQKAAEDTAMALDEAFKSGDPKRIVEEFKTLCQLVGKDDEEDEEPEEG